MNSPNEIVDMLDDFYHFDDVLLEVLVNSLKHPPMDDVRQILDSTFFYRYENGNGSWHFSRSVTQSWQGEPRAFVVLDADDLRDLDKGVVVTLHEAAHSFLGHHSNSNRVDEETYIANEDEAWAKVREWLPGQFAEIIDRHEAEGGGSKGQREQ